MADSSPCIHVKPVLLRPVRRDDFEAVRELLLESSNLYPGIDHWWKTKVQPDLLTGRRVGLVADKNSNVEGLFIGKPGRRAKLCTLRLRDEVRRCGIGRALITEGLHRLVGKGTNTVHVTISEAADEGCIPFFESVGFRRSTVARDRYLPGIAEYVYQSSQAEIRDLLASDLSQGLERTLFGSHPKPMPHEKALLMSLRPEFAKSILSGHKTVEFRRKFSSRHEGATIVFYVTSPVREFWFAARIAQVDHAAKGDLWRKHRQEAGVSKEVFDDYFSGTENGYAIVMEDVLPVPKQLRLDEAKSLMPEFRPPQSFQAIPTNSPLLQAMDVALTI